MKFERKDERNETHSFLCFFFLFRETNFHNNEQKKINFLGYFVDNHNVRCDRQFGC